jgi:alkanesulfonate monooxygenase SsuD/methylene tetrahydromethanopterin reductase-like flavin-dependent oxidoreductase (luciferase family)
MDIGIGLPATIPGVDRQSLLEWARRAEARGFSTLGTLDRLVYPNYEPLIALAAAAAVTERIRLTTDILIVPWRANAALLAKQTATVDALSGGRLVLGVATGARDDDYEASGVPMSGRGKRFEEMLEEMKRTWAGEERGYAGAIGPPPAQDGGPPLVIGGMSAQSEHALRRAVEIGDGWTMGGGTPDQFKEGSEKVKAAWSQAGRDGDPRLIALCYFALGDGAREAADSDLRHYYGWLGDLAEQIAQSAAVSPEMAQQYRDAFAEAGADELIYFPCSTDPGQVDLLAEAVL